MTIQNLWLPDVEILDLKAFETHSVLSKLEGWKELKKTHNRVKHENAAPILILGCASTIANRVVTQFLKSVQISILSGIWIDSNLEVMYALATR